jgi:hypothetical protein
MQICNFMCPRWGKCVKDSMRNVPADCLSCLLDKAEKVCWCITKTITIPQYKPEDK